MQLDEFVQAGNHVIEAEQATLGVMLQSPRAAQEILEVCSAACFYRPAHALVFEAISEVAEAKGIDAVDHLTVRERLTQKGQLVEVGGIDYLFDLESQAPAISNGMHYAAIVLEHAQRRKLKEVSRKIAEIASLPETMTPNEMVDLAADVVGSIRVDSPEEGFTEISPVLKQVFDEIDDSISGCAIKGGYNAHIAALSARVGGWSPGEVYVVAGATSMGKTAFARGEAINLVRQEVMNERGEEVNLPVLYVSAEVSEKQMTRLLLASYSGVAQKAIRGGRMMSQSEYEAVAGVAEDFYGLPLYYLCSGALTTARIAAKCEVIKRKHGIYPVVIVDYLQAIVGTGSGGSKTYAIDEFMKRVKDHARDKDLAYIVLSQIAREACKENQKGEMRRPTQFDLADSSGIEKWATAITIVHRPEYYQARKEGREENPQSLAEIITAKNRYGSVGVDTCVWVPRKVRFMEEAHG